MNSLLWAVLAVWMGSAGGAESPDPPPGERVDAITLPSADVMLTFLLPGKIAEVAVKEGQPVKAGDVIARLDDSVERVRLELLKMQAEDTVNVRAAEAQLAQAQVDLARDEEGFRKNVTTKFELEHSRLQVKIQELTVELAKLKGRAARLEYEEARLQVDRMRLVTMIDGRVERLHVKIGESVDRLTPVARVVQTAPLHIEVPAPVALAGGLGKGQAAVVRYRGGDGGAAETGRIIRIAEVADAASDTRAVKVELPNAANRPAGLHVLVEFPPASGPAKAEPAGGSDKTDAGTGKLTGKGQ